MYPIFPVLIDTWTRGFKATTARLIRMMAPRRSDHGARLKNIHQRRIPTADSIPANIATSPSGSEKISTSGSLRAGTTYLPSTSTIAKTTPGHSRRGFRGLNSFV
jgi:hypothetical protein